MTKTKRPFEQGQIRTRYRGWEIIATSNAATGKKKANGEHFEIKKVSDIETALRMAKDKVNRLEGEEVWTH